jgi:hypothetical protein
MEQITETKSNKNQWLNMLELIVTFKSHKGGALMSSNKFSETLKQIIYAVVPKEERQWIKESFQWYIHKKSDVRRVQETLNENNIKFLVIPTD